MGKNFLQSQNVTLFASAGHNLLKRSKGYSYKAQGVSNKD